MTVAKEWGSAEPARGSTIYHLQPLPKIPKKPEMRIGSKERSFVIGVAHCHKTLSNQRPTWYPHKTGILTLYTSEHLPCKWWFPFLLAEKTTCFNWAKSRSFKEPCFKTLPPQPGSNRSAQPSAGGSLPRSVPARSPAETARDLRCPTGRVKAPGPFGPDTKLHPKEKTWPWHGERTP